MEIAGSTLGNWVKDLAGVLQSVLAARKSLVLASQVVPSDYSGIRSPESSHPHGDRRSLLWADLGDRRELVFDFTPGRGADRPRAILLDDRGHLQVDAHSGHNAVSTEGRITQIDRRAHARRCFFDASGSDQENATHALALIARPHAIEREAKQLGLRALKPRVPPKSPLGQASGYALRPWDPPSETSKTDASRPMTAAPSEQVRGVAVAREDWTSAGTDDGARCVATISLVSSCGLLGIGPWSRFKDVLQRPAEGDGPPQLTSRFRKAARAQSATC